MGDDIQMHDYLLHILQVAGKSQFGWVSHALQVKRQKPFVVLTDRVSQREIRREEGRYETY